MSSAFARGRAEESSGEQCRSLQTREAEECGVKMPTPKGKGEKGLVVQTHLSASMYEESFDLLSPSRDFSGQYTPMSEPRFTTSQSLPRAEAKAMPPNRTQSSRFADRRLSPAASMARSPTMTTIGGPKAGLLDAQALEDGNRNVDLAFTNMGYAEVPAEKPREPPVYDIPNSKSFKMRKLKEPSLEDEWNDIVAEKKNRYRDCCCCVFSSAIVVLIAAGIVFTTMYFILKPSPPTIHVLNLNVTDFRLLSSTTTDGEPLVEASMTCVVRITNPNKFSVFHHRALNVSLNYKSEVLGLILVPGFKQSEKNVTDLFVTVPKSVAKITDQVDAINLLQEVNESNVRLEVRGSAEGHYRILGINVKKLDAPLLCKLSVKPENEDSAAQIISSSCFNPA
ncbi:protein MpLEA-like8 [Marchantia polymorpha subsp. ruderalis]|uniref:Late embryogenesis abundant protein LEA-2 subgroup domain-containing protein n=1 Tax=Marchantia polymorpha TaxID=3197 RepID=A0A2R6XAX7_MARPO|nr:hypothetical protein MARPO_0026s0134 [Marchantia polymorpha]BBN02050.1 hypothetical protein Mp_2g12370 [Marchantia polymorpha subsp. ruderalis]|eukprot:PTQ43271.1 hypothetical protein MARPO_0026s0134 [Marchantia polymorpha]